MTADAKTRVDANKLQVKLPRATAQTAAAAAASAPQ
jgi:hypothetical protein